MFKRWIGVSVALVGMGTAVSVLAATPELATSARAVGVAHPARVSQEELDFRVVNPVLQGLLDTVVAGDEYIDFAYPRFDADHSSFDREELKYDLQASLKNTPWIAGGRADVTVSSSFKTDRTSVTPGVDVIITSHQRTDVLAMIRYSALIAKQKASYTQDAEGERVRVHVLQASVVTTLDDFNNILLSGKQLAKDIMTGRLVENQTRLECVLNGSCPTYPGEADRLKSLIGRIRGWIAGVDMIQVNPTLKAGKVVELSIATPNLNATIERVGRDRIIPGLTTVHLTAETLDGEIRAHVIRTPAELDQLRDNLKGTLLGVQNGTITDKDQVASAYRGALKEFKRTIRGEF